jgi:hypothetical protein
MNYCQYFDNPDAILDVNNARVELNYCRVDASGHKYLAPDGPDWNISWKHGSMQLGRVDWLSKDNAKRMAALFIILYLKGIDPGEALDIAGAYGRYHNWFGSIQKLYQLRAIGLDSGIVRREETVIFSEKLWYTREQAEKQKEAFIQMALKQGMSVVNSVDIVTLEIGRGY